MRLAALVRPCAVRLADRQSHIFIPPRSNLGIKHRIIRTVASMSKEAKASKFSHLPRASTGPLECSLEVSDRILVTEMQPNPGSG